MTFLPDIDIGSWAEYQKKELERQLSEKVQSFGLGQAISEQMQPLHELAAEVNQFDQPPPAPPPAPVPVEPPPAPPPVEQALAPVELPPAVEQPVVSAAPRAVSLPPREGGGSAASTTAAPPEAPSSDPFSAWRQQVFGSGLNAITTAGGDAQAFADELGQRLGSATDRQSAFGAALNAATVAGVDVQQFASGLSVPEPPAPQRPPSAALPSQRQLEGPPGGLVNPQPTPAEVRSYITQAATARGIDPSIALKVANSEGGFEAARRGTFATGSSWWPFQLHYGGAGYEHLGTTAGMGNQFTKETGYQPGDPNAWQAATDYALDRAKQGGWGAWYGAKAQGITGYQGIDASAKDVVGQGFSDLGTRAQGAFRDISQFGDKQLTSDEAYAACGPAAAVRFAQRFGRNPSLKEALDLAKTVGWTQQQGMAGLGSQKALMDKLGVETQLVAGPQWGTFAREAQTGNPVTISTSAHYFYADGFNPETGQFHVGRSGTDLRGGKEWMTQAEIEQAAQRLGGGTVQGALLASNPTVGARTTADPTSSMGFSFGERETQEADATASRIESMLTEMESSRKSLGQEVQGRLQQLMGESTDQTMASTGGSQRILDESAIGRDERAAERDVVGRVGSFFEGLGTDVRRQQQEAQALNPYLGGTVGGGFGDVSTAITSGLERAGVPGHKEFGFEVKTPELPVVGEVPIQIGPRELLGLATDVLPTGALPARAAREALGEVAPEVAEAAARAARHRLPAEAEAGFAAGMPTGGSGAAREAFEGAAAKPGQRVTVEGPAGTVSARVGSETPYESVMPTGTFEQPIPPTAPIGERLEGFRQGVVRHLFDRDIDLNLAQEKYAKSLDRPLTEAEMVAERKRLVGDGQARVLEDEILTPVFRAAGDDYQAVRDLYTLRGNVQVADAVGEQVMREAADAAVPTALKDSLQTAQASLRQLENVLTRLEADSVPDAARIAAARRAVNQAQRTVTTRQAKVEIVREQTLLDATVKGKAAAEAREFSGDLSRAESEVKIEQMRQQLGDERFERVSGFADQVANYPKALRQRLVEAGVMSEDQAAELQRLYPDWAQTQVLDWMDDVTPGGQAAGTRIGMGNAQMRRYSVEGTKRARVDPFASLVSYGHQTMRQARKNEAAQALVAIDEASSEKLLRQVPEGYKPKPEEEVFPVFIDGEKRRYVTDNKLVGQAINSAGVMDAPEWSTKWQQIFRGLATSRNPVFLAGNTALDVPAYMLRGMTWEGGPQHFGKVAAALIKSYGDTFKGITTGEYKGEGTRRFLAGGGGQAGFFGGAQRGSTKEAGKAGERVAQMRRGNVLEVRNGNDLKRIIKDIALFKPVEALGERLELAPRVAAMNLAEKRGLGYQQAVIQGRDVTVDFGRGGQTTKYLNHFIPFFNVGFQGTAQLDRLIRSNPGAAMSTIGTTIGLPTVAAEVWNRGYNPDGTFDQQRADDYADVPQTDKDRGVVVMLPGEGKGEQGERKPLYAVLDLRNFAVFSTATRDGLAKAMGDDSRDWQDLALSLGQAATPTKALTSPTQAVSELGSIAPGVGTLGQLGINRDLFTGGTIVSERQDERASETAKRLTPVVQEVLDRAAPGSVARPSWIDFAVKDVGAGVGSALLSGSDLALAGADVLAGKEPQVRREETPATLPGLGGLAGRFVRSGSGERFRQESEERITPELRRIFADAGIPNYQMAPADREVSIGQLKIPLLPGEQAGVQKRINEYVKADLNKISSGPGWPSRDAKNRQEAISDVISDARRRAELEVLGTIPGEEIDRRLDEAEAKAERDARRQGQPSPVPVATPTGRVQRLPPPRRLPTS